MPTGGPQHATRIREQIANRAVVFVLGAGVTTATTSRGPGSWNDLLRSAADYAQERQSTAWRINVDSDLQLATTVTLASGCGQDYGSPRRGRRERL